MTHADLGRTGSARAVKRGGRASRRGSAVGQERGALALRAAMTCACVLVGTVLLAPVAHAASGESELQAG